jgi:DUF3108-like
MSKMQIKKWAILLVTGILLLNCGLVWGINFGDAGLYYPLKVGNQWVYRTNYAGQYMGNILIEITKYESGLFTQESRIRTNSDQKFINFGKVSIQENEQGIFLVTSVDSQGIEKNYQPVQLNYASVIKSGITWYWESDDKTMNEIHQVLGEERLTVPAGTFDTMKITVKGKDEKGQTYETQQWLAKNVGLVKGMITNQDTTMVLELDEYHLK